MVDGKLVVACILLVHGPLREVITSNCVHNVDEPLARKVVPLIGIGQELIDLWVVCGLLQDGLDGAVVILGHVEVTDIITLDELLLAGDEVYTDCHGHQSVLTL